MERHKRDNGARLSRGGGIMFAPKKLLLAVLRIRKRKIVRLTLVEIVEPKPIDKDYKIAEG